MDARFPIPEFGAMALPAKFVRLFELDDLSARRMQYVPVFSIMAVHAPPVLFVMREFDIIVELFQHTPLRIGIHIRMAFHTGKIVLAEGRRRHLDILLDLRKRID
jgi:hypothetical protein